MTDTHINKVRQYVQSLTPEIPIWALKLEQYAEENRVPIIDRVSVHFLLQLIRMHQPTTILEIGTAIGYSALRMHEVVPKANIITIEKNEEMFAKAKENITLHEANNYVTVIQGDALEHLKRLLKQEALFDFAFIDAAKGQYEHFFNAIDPLMTKGGIIVSDNVLFREYVTSHSEKIPKRYKNLVSKLQSFNEKIMNHENYHSSIIPLGDGLLVSVKI